MKLKKRLEKLEKEYENAPPLRRARIFKRAESIERKLEKQRRK